MGLGVVIELCDRSCIHRWINLLNTHIIQSPQIIVGDAIVELSPLQEKQEKIWKITKQVLGVSVAILVLPMSSKVAMTGTDRPMYVLAAAVPPMYFTLARKADHAVPRARITGDRAAVLLFPLALRATCRSTTHHRRSSYFRCRLRQSDRPQLTLRARSRQICRLRPYSWRTRRSW